MKPDLKNLEKLQKEVNKLNLTISKKCTEIDKIIDSIQRSCKHLNVVECKYHPDDYNPKEPERLCRDCGCRERGWDCGYHILYDAEGRTIEEDMDRKAFFKMCDTHKYGYRLVGQSHPQFHDELSIKMQKKLMIIP